MKKLIDINPTAAALEKFIQYYRHKMTSDSNHHLCFCFFSTKVSLTSNQTLFLDFFYQQLSRIHAQFHDVVEKSIGRNLNSVINQNTKMVHTIRELEARAQSAKQIDDLIHQTFLHPELKNLTDFHAFLVELQSELRLSFELDSRYPSAVVCLHR